MIFLKRLAVLMFYASIPLLIPLGYSLHMEDGAWQTLAFTFLLLALPAIPELLKQIFSNLKITVVSLLRKDIPFNYTSLIDTQKMRQDVEELTLGQILALVSAAWLIIPAISTIPYIAYSFSPVDAYFESVSGWTSTGLSAIPNLEGLPPSIILFRSVTQWVGGLGIVVLMLTVMKGREAKHFLRAEGRSQMDVGISKTAGSIWGIYLVFTLAALGLLYLAGFGPLDATNLSLAINGGFLPFNPQGFSHYQAIVIAFLMFCGAISFALYRRIASGKIREAFADEELKFYVALTLCAILAIFLIGNESIYNSFMNAVSAISCGGFSLGELLEMRFFSIYILILLMLMGGMMGSVTGGIKLWRILVVFKSILRNIKAAFRPVGTVQMVKVNGISVSEEAIGGSSTFIFAYVALFLFGCGVLMALDYQIEDSMFMIASAMGNVGLAIIPIPEMAEATKLFLIALMYLGRIEIFPSLALLRLIMRR